MLAKSLIIVNVENCGGWIIEHWISIRIIWVLVLVHYPVFWTEHISETGSVPVLTLKGDNITIWLRLLKTPNASHWNSYILVSRCLYHHWNCVPAQIRTKLVPSQAIPQTVLSFMFFDDTCTSSNNVLHKMLIQHTGHAVAQLVEALRYKPEGCWFDSRWCQWDF
jgi:hypothetical protein